MFVFLRHLLSSLIECGDLTVVAPDGSQHRFGDRTGPPLRVRIASDWAATKLLIHPDLYVGECYMSGELMVEAGTIYDALALLLDNAIRRQETVGSQFLHRLRRLTRRIAQYNPRSRARRNVAHHYDLTGELYDLFLDADRQYSCAYFETAEASLDEAQLAKKRHLAAKLMIRPGMRVLDIGSGWGGLGIYLADVCGAEVVGVTLSEEQHKVSSDRARDRGLADRVEFRLMDYRDVEGPFDRIVSVGMFEHVGVNHYREFFRKVASLLKENGVAVLHSISRSGGPSATSAWTAKYIFPGGYIPALSEVVPVMERTGLYITDIEILRLHYAQTLREWRRQFAHNRDKARELFDERFCRMWEYYLAISETAFRFLGMNNFQIQFCLDQHALPLTRGYIKKEEERLRAIDTPRPRLKKVPAE